jgi:cysteinyl-tRNA synthetase
VGNLLGFFLQEPSQYFHNRKSIDKHYVESMIEKRKEAKLAKNWALADQIRDELKEKGIELEDNPNGSTSWK